MTVEEALDVARKVGIELVPVGWAAALYTLAAEVRRLRELRDVEALIAERDQLREENARLDALLESACSAVDTVLGNLPPSASDKLLEILQSDQGPLAGNAHTKDVLEAARAIKRFRGGTP